LQVESIFPCAPMAWAPASVLRDSPPHFFVDHFRGIGRNETD